MKKFLITGTVITLTAIANITTAQQKFVVRKDLLTALVSQHVANVEVKEVTMAGGEKAPTHLHPCPVVGYVKTGKVLFQIEGEEEIILNEGDAFFEPKNKKVLHFDNALKSEPLTFIALYMKEAGEDNVRAVKN